MAKTRHKDKTKNTITTPSKQIITLSDLRQDPTLWYKLLLLIHDLRAYAKDKQSQHRLDKMNDPSYIGAPYFSPAEADTVKGVLVDQEDGTQRTVEETLTSRFQSFFEKRRASGDWRPCGPHDMAPVLMALFAVTKGDVEEERFLARARRSGLGGV